MRSSVSVRPVRRAKQLNTSQIERLNHDPLFCGALCPTQHASKKLIKVKRRKFTQTAFFRSLIIPEQASQTLPAFNAIGRASSVSRLGEQQDISLPLMRTLGMKMRKVLVERSPERSLAEQDQP